MSKALYDVIEAKTRKVKKVYDVVPTSVGMSRNLLKQRQFGNHVHNGISFVQQADGGIKVSGTASADALCNLSFAADATTVTFSYPVGTLTASVTEKNAALAIIAQPENATVVEGGTAVFTVTATGEGLSYQWKYRYSTSSPWTDSGKDGAKTDTLRFVAADYHNGYDYCCVITDANGNSVTSESAKLTIAPIVITQQPVNQTVVENGMAVFTVVAEGEGLSYQWEHMTTTGTKWNTTTAGTGVTTNELGIEGKAYRDGYIYHCVITDANGNSVTSESAKLTIAPIVISQQPDDQTVAEGNTAVFTVTAEGKSLTYQWQWRANSTASWGNTTVTGNQTNSITVEATIGRNGYQYRCLIKDANENTKLTNAVTLIVESQANPITITSQPTSVTAVFGSKVVFTVTAEGEGLTYQWEWRANSDADWSNTTVAGNQTNSITVEATIGRNGYQYRCLIKDANGYGKLSNAVTLTIGEEQTLVLAFGGWDENGATVSKGTVSVGRNLTFEGNGESARIYLMVYSGAAVDTVVYPQLELGSEATDYVPYGEVYKSIARKVKKAYIGVGGVAGYSEKNLLPFPNAVTYRGVTVTPLRDGGLHIVGTLDEGNTSALISRTFDGSALTGSTYTLSAWTDTPVANGGLQVRLRDASSGTINNSNIAVDALHKYTNISNADITATVRIAIRVVEGITYDHVIYLQLEEGSESTEFEPYEIWKNVARQFYSAEFLEYSGEYEVLQVAYEGKTCNLYRLKTSGLLTLNDDALFWMCSGGENGSNGSSSASNESATGGRGGYGGSMTSGQIASGSNWAVTIGAGGSYTGTGASSITDGTTTHKTGSRPASGYGPGSNTDDWSEAPAGGAGAGVSTYPFGITSLKAHCPGGGGGGAAILYYSSYHGTNAVRYQPGGQGGSNGGNGQGYEGNGGNGWSGPGYGGTGGVYGGGKGASVVGDNYDFTYTEASAGFWYGAGGGGGCGGGCNEAGWKATNGKSGYQGVVYILDVNGGVPA